ncbi:hypothetical protein MUP77_22630 [Candidatus Bathyarchaeota archaeon]|nr:hypothetical protein [Candidatus Bathyarchaeota archaeon]
MNTLEFLVYYVGSFFLVIILPVILSVGFGMNGFVVFVFCISIMLASSILYRKIGHARFESYSKVLRISIRSPQNRLIYGAILVIIGSVLSVRVESLLLGSYYSGSAISLDAVNGSIFAASIITLFVGLGMLISRVRLIGHVTPFLSLGLVLIHLSFLGFTLACIAIMFSLYYAEREGKMSWGTPDS